MPSRIVATILTIACTAVVTVMLPSNPAQAFGVVDTSRTERVIQDAPFDVMENVGAEEHEVPAPERTIGDITGFSVRHGEDRVRFRISAQELVRPARDETVFAVVSARTDDAAFSVFVMLNSIDGTRTTLVGRKYGRVRHCPGMTGSFDEASDSVTISLPRRCVRTPRWVQAIASLVYGWPEGLDDYFGDYVPDQPSDGPRNYTRRAWHPRA